MDAGDRLNLSLTEFRRSTLKSTTFRDDTEVKYSWSESSTDDSGNISPQTESEAIRLDLSEFLPDFNDNFYRLTFDTPISQQTPAAHSHYVDDVIEALKAQKAVSDEAQMQLEEVQKLRAEEKESLSGQLNHLREEFKRQLDERDAQISRLSEALTLERNRSDRITSELKGTVAECQEDYSQLHQQHSSLAKESQQTQMALIDSNCQAELMRVEKEMLEERFNDEVIKSRSLEDQLNVQTHLASKFKEDLRVSRMNFHRSLAKTATYRHKYNRMFSANKSLVYHKSFLTSLLKQHQNPQQLYLNADYQRPKRSTLKIVAVAIRAVIRLTWGGKKCRQRLTSLESLTTKLNSNVVDDVNDQTAFASAFTSQLQSTLNTTELDGLVPLKRANLNCTNKQ